MRRKFVFLVGASVLVLGAADAAAYTYQDPGQDQDQDAASTLDEIVVTARRRTESLQTVPVAVSVVSAEALQNNLATDLSKISELAPQVVIGRATIGTGAVIGVRGISSTSNDPGLDQSVAVAIDGVVLSRGRVISTAMFDLGQVEILEGPQALFFGKNSPAGVVSITSAGPSQTFEGYVRAGYEFEARERYFEAAVSGPITDTLSARVAVRASQMDGWIENVAEPVPSPLHPGVTIPGAEDDERQPGGNEYAGRLSLLWTPTDDLDVEFKVLATRQELNAFNAFAESFCTNGVTTPTLFGTIPLPNSDCRKDRRKAEGRLPAQFAANYPYGNGGVPNFISNNLLASLTVNRHFGDITLTSTTGYYAQDFHGTNNADYTDYATFWGAQAEDYTLFTQEIRVNSDFDGPFNFSAGAYYERSDRWFWNSPAILFSGLNVAANNWTSFETAAQADTSTWSVFAQGRWRFAPTWELAFGARYTDDQKEQDAWNVSIGATTIPMRPAGSVLTSRFSDTNLSPEATLSWNPAPGQLVYVGYRSGYKAGAISNGAILGPTATADSLTIGSETAEGIEVGYKGDLLQNTLRLNLVAYSYDFEDLQLGTYSPITNSFTIQNAAAARTQGAQVSVEWLAADNLVLSGNIGYNRARYTQFADAPCYTGQTAAAGCVSARQDLTGAQLTRAPDLTATVGLDYERPFSNGWTADFALSASYSDSYQSASDNDPGGLQESFWRLNAALHLTPPEDRLRFSIIGRNLTDSYYLMSTSARPVGGPNEYIGVFNRPREIVLQAQYRF